MLLQLRAALYEQKQENEHRNITSRKYKTRFFDIFIASVTKRIFVSKHNHRIRIKKRTLYMLTLKLKTTRIIY